MNRLLNISTSITLMLLMLIYVGCESTTAPKQDLSNLAALRLVADSDTLLLLSGNQRTITAQGSFVEVSENTISNSGALVDTFFVDITTNTTVESISASSLTWKTSNPAVATVKNGTITGISTGTAAIWAEKNEISSDSIIVVVSAADLPPRLILDPPPVQLIFQDSTNVTGWVTSGLDLTLTINSDTVDYEESGRFQQGVSLIVGENTYVVKATNNSSGLFSTGTKLFIYYTFDTAGITGTWRGETLTRPFTFEIYNYLGTYFIDGTLTVDFTLLGGPLIVEDIVIAGLIQDDGTIDATAGSEESGFIVTGTLGGIFLNSGRAEGSYSLKLEKEGVGSVFAKAKWRAERDL